MITQKETIKEISQHLNDIMDLLTLNNLDTIIKFNDEDLYSIIQDIDNEINGGL